MVGQTGEMGHPEVSIVVGVLDRWQGSELDKGVAVQPVHFSCVSV